MAKFDLFISYSSRDEVVEVASKKARLLDELQRALEAHVHPFPGERPARGRFRVCTYRRDFELAESVPIAIRNRIRESKALMVVSSNEASKSQYVQSEIEEFLKNDGNGILLAARLDLLPELAFPDHFQPGALAADIAAHPGTTFAEWRRQIQDESHKVVARVWGLDPVQVYDRFEAARKRTTRRVLAALSAALCVFILLGGVAMWQGWSSVAAGRVADAQRIAAIASASQREEPRELTTGHSWMHAMLLGVEATRRYPTVQATAVLRSATEHHPVLVRSYRHNGIATAITVDLEENLVATADRRGRIRIWNLQNGDLLAIFNIDEDAHEIVLADRGKRIVTSGSSGSTRVWDVATGKQIPGSGMDEDRIAVAISPGGRYGAFGGRDLAIVELVSGEVVKLIEGLGTRQRWSIAFSEGADMIADRRRGEVHILSAPTFDTTCRYEGRLDRGLSFSPDGTFLATWSLNEVHVVDIESCASVGNLRTPVDHNGIAWSGDRPVVGVARDDGLGIWNFEDGTDRLIRDAEGVRYIAFLDKQDLLVTAGPDGTVRVRQHSTMHELSYMALDGQIGDMIPLPHSSQLLIRNHQMFGSLVLQWNLNPTAHTVVKCPSVQAAVLSHDGSSLVAVCGQEVCAWKTDSGVQKWCHELSGTIRASLVEEQQLILVVSREGILMADAESGAVAWRAESGLHAPITIHAVDHERFVTVHEDGSVHLRSMADGTSLRSTEYDLETKRVVLESIDDDSEWVSVRSSDDDDKEGEENSVVGKVVHAIVSPDNRYLVAGSSNGLVFISELPALRQLQRFQLGSFGDSVNSLDFSGSGAFFAASNGSELDVFQVASGRHILRRRIDGGIERVSHDPKGGRIAVCSGFNNWTNPTVVSSATGKVLLALEGVAGASGVRFSPDGGYILGIDDSKPTILRVWHARDGRLIAEFYHDSAINDFVLSGDGSHVAVTTSADEIVVRLWMPEDLALETCRRLYRNMTPEEWDLYLDPEEYRATCENLPTYIRSRQ